MPKIVALLFVFSIVACVGDDAPTQDPPTCAESHCVSLACEDTDAGVLCTCGLKDDTYVTCAAE